MTSELVEVVDRNGRVQTIVSRAEMRRGNLLHRATYVVVLRSTGELLVHQRAPWKDLWPSRYDLAFGGVCGVGESWLDAARRELAEEAGIAPEAGGFCDRGELFYEDEHTAVLGRWFEVHHDGPFHFDDGEVVASDWVPRSQLAGWARTRSLCPDSAAALLPAYAIT